MPDYLLVMSVFRVGVGARIPQVILRRWSWADRVESRLVFLWNSDTVIQANAGWYKCHGRSLLYNVPMTHIDIRTVLKTTSRGTLLQDERGRTMSFPGRRDYVRQLQEFGLATDEAAFIASDCLTEAVYLDWLRRSQVGCIFAQLLARPGNRTKMRTVVARGSSRVGDPSELAVQIAELVDESVQDPSSEALSVLMPHVLNSEVLAQLVWDLGNQPGWDIELEHEWRGTLVLIGMRVRIATGVVAETLGMGPLEVFPPTRQCPITTLEVRTKSKRAKKSRLSKVHLAAHLADIPTDHMLTRISHRALFSKFTPWLRRRILENQQDTRAKAGVTYSLPIPIWRSLKARGS